MNAATDNNPTIAIFTASTTKVFREAAEAFWK
jgi:hypothetical protein